jgi:hypothetical protein
LIEFEQEGVELVSSSVDRRIQHIKVKGDIPKALSAQFEFELYYRKNRHDNEVTQAWLWPRNLLAAHTSHFKNAMGLFQLGWKITFRYI